jgi:hypothetical protein
MLRMLTTRFRCLQEIPPSDPVDQGVEGDLGAVGEPAGANRSPAPTVEELVSQLTCQPLVAEGGGLSQLQLLLLKSRRLRKLKRSLLLKLE